MFLCLLGFMSRCKSNKIEMRVSVWLLVPCLSVNLRDESDMCVCWVSCLGVNQRDKVEMCMYVCRVLFLSNINIRLVNIS